MQDQSNMARDTTLRRRGETVLGMGALAMAVGAFAGHLLIPERSPTTTDGSGSAGINARSAHSTLAWHTASGPMRTAAPKTRLSGPGQPPRC